MKGFENNSRELLMHSTVESRPAALDNFTVSISLLEDASIGLSPRSFSLGFGFSGGGGGGGAFEFS